MRSSTRRVVSTFPLLACVALATAAACGNDRQNRGVDPGSDMGGQGTPEYTGDAVVVPATIQAEDFVAANEINKDFDEQDESCTSSVEPDVDINSTGDGGCAIGYTNPGEWFEYDIYVPEAGSFDLQFHVATGASASIELSVDGESRQSAQIPTTSWDDYTDVIMQQIQLAQGEHRLRVTVASGATNLDWFAVLRAGDCLGTCGEQECGMDLCGNSCGSCGGGETCSTDFQCLTADECAATCEDKACGMDACGGSCGSCADDLICTPSGQCWDNSVKPVAKHGQLSISGTKIIDENGDVTQLKGMSTQWLNWERTYSVSRPALEWLRDNWALSLYRVANGVENSNGYLADPEERMETVKGIIDNAIALDVYVLVDWHTHEPEHIEEAKAFFAEIAQTYGDQPNIIYEVFNEPLDVDWSADLKPYHDEVVAEIRKHDPDNIIVVGTPRWDQLPHLAAEDPIDDPNVAYALHFYSCTHNTSIMNNGTQALEAGLPIMVTEWGATHADGGTAENPAVCEDSARQWHAWMEENDISWAAWKLSADGDTSAILTSGASADGGWTEDDIHGHGYLVHEFMMDEL